MKIAINSRPLLAEHYLFIKNLYFFLIEKKVELQVSPIFYKWLEDNKLTVDNVEIFHSFDDLDADNKYVISIGGDGTFLETVTYVGTKEIPILGINAGRLGFLATVSLENISKALEDLLLGEMQIEQRTIISLESNKDLFNGVNFAVNEFAILKKDTSSMIVVDAYLNGKHLNSYWSDGLIISTPTGSTGYSLSCGGPLLMPQVSAFIISPVSPHNLNVRPLVVPDNCELTFKIEDRQKKFLVALDSRSKPVDPNVELKVKKANFKLNLLAFEGADFLSTLRKKLLWGLDSRN